MTAPVTAEQVDAALARLGAVCDRMAERLVALDGHEGQRLLDAARLPAGSQRRWLAAKARLTEVWACFEAYRDALATARELRGRWARPSEEQLARLGGLLSGRLVELPDGPGTSEWLAFDELAVRMEDGYREVSSLVTAAVAGWSELARRLDPLTGQLASARAEAAALGLGGDAELAAVEAELAALRWADPLVLAAGGTGGVGAAGGRGGRGGTGAAGDRGDRGGEDGGGGVAGRLAAVAARLDRVTERLGVARRLHDGYGALRAGLAARIDELTAAVADARELDGTVRAKIAPAPAPAPAPASAGAEPAIDAAAPGRLQAGLGELDELAGRPDWGELAQRYAAVDAELTGALSAVRAATDRLRELLDRRSELRLRLDGYRAKAGQLGHAEDGTLAGLYRAAHELLWVAPCDLAAATRAVARYQAAVNMVVRN